MGLEVSTLLLPPTQKIDVSKLITNITTATLFPIYAAFAQFPISGFMMQTSRDIMKQKYIIFLNTGYTDIINTFGLFGDQSDRATLYTYRRNEPSIFCGSSLPGVEIDWFFSNGTKVGISNRNIREGHYSNGTTILQFGIISVCDTADLYTCRANQSATGKVQQRTFNIQVNCELLILSL